MRSSIVAASLLSLLVTSSFAAAQPGQAAPAPSASAASAPAAPPELPPPAAAAPAAPAPAPVRPRPPAPGHVADPVLVPPGKGAASPPEPSEEPAAPETPASPPKPTTGPTTGFMLEARLSHLLSPIDTSGQESSITAFTVTPPAAALGYRGESWAVLAGPTWNRYEVDVSADKSRSLSFIGITALGEFTVARSDDRRAEGYLLTGLSLSSPSVSTPGSSSSGDDGFSGEIAWGLLTGFGARYWVSPHLGVGGELGLGYINYPAGREASSTVNGPSGSTSSDAKAKLRGNGLSTFGSIGVTLVL